MNGISASNPDDVAQMTYQEAVTYLDSLTNYERTHQPQAMQAVRLERMQRLCEQVGAPQRRFRSVLVAGTNSKGSVCAMIYTILRAAGLRVGLYTSPHLDDVRERIRLSGDGERGIDWISHDEFAALIARLQPAVGSFQDDPEGLPTYFEVMTAAALLHFARRRVDVAVLEVGLGGRLDATNVVEPAVSVIGPIGLDHTDVLGADLVSIAREKAGIIRRGGQVISAAQPPAVSEFLQRLAAEQGCRWLECGRQLGAEVIAHEAPDGLRFTVQGTRGRYGELSLPLLGRHQAENAAVAIAAVEALSDAGAPYCAVQAGLEQVSWPGRIEFLQDEPVVILDGAHNPPAAQALRVTLEELWPDRAIHLLIGMSADKPAEAIAEILAPIATSVTCTKSRHPRGCPAQELARAWKPHSRAVAMIPDGVDAYTYVVNTISPDDVLVVTGSLFLVGDIRAALRRAGHALGAAVAELAREQRGARCPW